MTRLSLPADPALLQDRFRGALVGAVVGDALGANFEGHRGPITYGVLDEHLIADTPLRYTDDTALTIAVAESVLQCDGVDEDHLAASLAAAYQQDPGRGYGSGTAELLRQYRPGSDWRGAAAAQFGGAGSFGNGAAMRVAPIALLAGANPTQAADLARRSALPTHTHPVGVEGAVVQAAAVSLTLGDVEPGALATSLQMLTTENSLSEQLWAVADLPSDTSPVVVATTLGTGVAADDSVPAALAAYVLNDGSFAATVRFAIALGGDTDTLASMAAAIAGARLGLAAVPRSWLDRTEGIDRVIDLADQLAQRHHIM